MSLSSHRITLLRNSSLAVLGVLLTALAVIAFLTYNADPQSSGIIGFAVREHMLIMAALLIIAVLFGFASSLMFSGMLVREQRGNQKLLEVVLQFLQRDERAILQFLVEHNGQAAQADIARLPHMDRVKAHRTVQKLAERQLITITAHGKVRKLQLAEGLHDLLVRTVSQ